MWLALQSFAVLGLAISIPGHAGAVLLANGDGTGNRSAPSQDPGFDHVGSITLLSGVYVRNGWVLTAGHVGVNPIQLLGQTYQPIAGSGVTIRNGDDSAADLIAFKLATKPPLSDLQIADSPLGTNALITMVGNGRTRGAATNWMGVDGWQWGTNRQMRWGTNRVALTNQFSLNTHSFWVLFDDIAATGANPAESDLIEGDSGGAAFTGSGQSAELVGILFAHAGFDGQPASTSLFGNAGIISDLYAYRNDILAIIDQPDCNDGLDDDGDGTTDYPNDPGCTSPTDASERDPSVVCDNEVDDDGDGLMDYPGDPGCYGPADSNERGAVFECDNGLDDDNDSAFDYPSDPGCLHPTNPVEAPEPGAGALLASGLIALRALARRRPTTRRSTFQAVV